jgi:hypothetical protein
LEADFLPEKIGNRLGKIRPYGNLGAVENVNVRRIADVAPRKNPNQLKIRTVSSGLTDMLSALILELGSFDALESKLSRLTGSIVLLLTSTRARGVFEC